MFLKRSILFAPLSLLSLTALSGAILMSSSVNADNDSVVDEINITVPVSCTLSGTGMTSHTASIPNGTYNSNIGETTITTFCNDNSGFAIYAIGYTDNEEGKNVLTNSTLGSDYDIATGTQTSGDTSKWAMKLSTVTSPTPTYPITIQNSFDSFHNVPDDYTKVAYRTSSTDVGANAEGATLTTTYQAYISATQSAGTYTGQVKYTLVHPHDATKPKKPINYTNEIDCPAGYICYSPAANGVEGTMNVQDVGTYALDTDSVIGYQPASSNTTTTLIAPNFKHTGYGFAGWNTSIDGTGTDYGPNEDITTSNLSESGLALYAKWIPSSGNLQGWTGCSTMSANQVIALTDTRDNDTYAVAKLADGNCWMIENLRLDNTATITTTNTDNTYTTFFSEFMSSTSSDNWCNASRYTYCVSKVIINTNNTIFGGTNTSGIDLVSSPFTNNNYSQWYSYGNYYNWYTATAGQGGNEGEEDSNAHGSICPIGWSLPTGTSSGQFFTLNMAANSSSTTDDADLRKFPNNFIYAGAWEGNQSIEDSRGYIGVYQSLTDTGYDDLVQAEKTYRLIITNSFVSPATFSNDTTLGSSVRCLAK